MEFDNKARSSLAHPISNRGGAKQIPRHIDIHITGTGLHAKAQRQRIPALKRLLEVFGTGAFSTFGIDPWGEIWQFAACDRRQGAQGWAGLGGYSGVKAGLISEKRAAPKWWRDTWQPILSARDGEDKPRVPAHGYSPLDLLDADEDSPNDNSISIECIQWQRSYEAWSTGKAVNYLLTTAQYVALHNLIVDRCTAWGIPLWDPIKIRGHEDTNPWSRGTVSGGGWDPGASRPGKHAPRFCWECLESLDFAHQPHPRTLPITDLCPCMIPTPAKKSWE